MISRGSLGEYSSKAGFSETKLSDKLAIDASARALQPERDRADAQHSSQIDWHYPAGVTAVHLLALLAFLPFFFSWIGVFLAIMGIFVFGTLGINVGYHRLLTHGSFSCACWLKRTLVLLGTCCVLESPAYWVAMHRRHHQFADHEADPHSPGRSFFWAHLGWYMVKVEAAERTELLHRYAKDVLRDPLFRFLERNLNWLVVVVISWLAFFTLTLLGALVTGMRMADAMQLGASVLVWGVFVRTVYVFQVTMCVNSVTHKWGYRTYQTEDNSKNNVWIGLLSNGEGWHNNHHADARSARHGHSWWELDIAWLTIRSLERIGLTWDVAGFNGPAHPASATCVNDARLGGLG